jgi:SAM-dependent methyltransferase
MSIFVQQANTSEHETVEVVSNGSSFRSYGLTWRNYGSFERKALNAIASFPASPTVRVADLGAGHGFFTKKVLESTHAHVVAFELVKDAADRTLDNAKSARLPEGESLKQRLRVLKGDWIRASNKASGFDVIWSAQHMHFCRPVDVHVYMDTMCKILNPQGLVFMLVHFPSGNPEAMSIYDEAKRQGAKFPGYFLLQEVPSSELSALDESADLLPGERHAGVYGGSDSTEGVYHSKHFFDHEVLGRAFNESGFEIIERVVVNLHEGTELPLDALDDPLLRNTTFMLVGVVARKVSTH